MVAVVVFQEMTYGAMVSSAPRFRPSSVNWTPSTPTLSVEVAETAKSVPDAVTPDVGAVRATAGGVVSAAGTVVTVRSDDVARLPAASLDFTR